MSSYLVAWALTDLSVYFPTSIIDDFNIACIILCFDVDQAKRGQVKMIEFLGFFFRRSCQANAFFAVFAFTICFDCVGHEIRMIELIAFFPPFQLVADFFFAGFPFSSPVA